MRYGPSMSENIVGGQHTRPRYLALYLSGVLIGSAVRLAAWVAPKRIVADLEDRLLPGEGR